MNPMDLLIFTIELQEVLEEKKSEIEECSKKIVSIFNDQVEEKNKDDAVEALIMALTFKTELCRNGLSILLNRKSEDTLDEIEEKLTNIFKQNISAGKPVDGEVRKMAEALAKNEIQFKWMCEKVKGDDFTEEQRKRFTSLQLIVALAVKNM